ncbi:hypothetical protein J3459_012477 [Metarhizium acridum]|nr:hypothetical protein J3459_012477 [Metarhizium acridum]
MASQRTAPTLRHVLCQQKPTIRYKSKLNRNSRNAFWPELDVVTIWRDFNLANLNESYGHILDADDPQHPLDLPQVEILQGVETKVDRDIGHLIGWNDALMQQTLPVAKTRLGICQESNLTYRYSTPDKSFIARLPNARSASQVAHVIGLDNPLEPVLVVGVERLSSKWTSMKLLAKLPEPVGEITLPVRQLGHLCQISGTRYGYIQTEEELVACCFSDSDAGNERNLTVAIMPIPWTKHGLNMLTTELALWWLCMIAMSPNHSRRIQKEQDMVKINEWECLRHDAGTIVMRHQYSNFEKSMNGATPSIAFTNLGPTSPGVVVNQDLVFTPQGPTSPGVVINQDHSADSVEPKDPNNLHSPAALENWDCLSNSADPNAWYNMDNWVNFSIPNSPNMLSMNRVSDSDSNHNTKHQ